MTFALISRPSQSLETQRTAPTGPTLIDPKLFKLIGGGLPKGTWAVEAPLTVCLPKGTW